MSTWKGTKKKMGGTLPALLVMLSFVLWAPTFIMLWNGIGGFVAQHEQINWLIVDAVVVDVEEQDTYSNQPGHASRRTGTRCEVYYEYTVDEKVYSGHFWQGDKMDVGESMKIKYNPDAPQYSTEELDPLRDAVKNVAVGVGTGAVAVIAVVTANILKKRRKQNNDL